MPREMFRHYMGGVYEWLATAKHIETGEVLSIYRGDNGQVWARPLEMFNGETESGVKRFTRIGEDDHE